MQLDAQPLMTDLWISRIASNFIELDRPKAAGRL
jgi:hypothetical protein